MLYRFVDPKDESKEDGLKLLGHRARTESKELRSRSGGLTRIVLDSEMRKVVNVGELVPINGYGLRLIGYHGHNRRVVRM